MNGTNADSMALPQQHNGQDFHDRNGESRARIEQDLDVIMSLFNGNEPLYCLCSGPYMTSMIPCHTCCNHYHTACLDRYQCQYTQRPFICPLCNQSLTAKQVAILDERLYREAQARTRASKKSRSSLRPSDIYVDSDDIILNDDIVPIQPTKPRPASATTKKPKSKKPTIGNKEKSS